MPITYPYRNNLFAYATGFVGMEGGNARDGAAAVPLGVSGPGDGAEGGGNTRPARAPRCHFRYKTRPAHSKCPVLARFACAGRTLYRIRGGHEASRHNHTPSATGVEDAGGTGGHGLGAGGWRQGQGGYISDTVSQAPHERAQANKIPTSVIGCRPVVEVARQCSNLAPALQHAACEQQGIRRRTRSAMSSTPRTAPQPVPRLTDAMLDEAQGRYEANTTLQLIANDLGVSRQRLAVRLRERGVAIRGEGPSREQVLEMVRRYSQGESLAKVGTRLGFSGGTVRAYLIRAGVPIREAQGRSR